jgi:hypothetical protein
MSAYSDLKEVGKDAWSVGTDYIAPYVFGEKDITGTPTEPSNGHTEAIPADGEFKPTSGNKTFDKCLEFFL